MTSHTARSRCRARASLAGCAALIALATLAGSAWAQTAAQTAVQTMPLFRYYDPQGGGHFWTTNPAEMAAACKRCRKEGPAAWLLTTGSVSGSVPLYRFYDSKTGRHFWTTDADWGAKACKRCRREGIAGWVLPKPTLPGAIAFNRYYNPSTGKHFWTVDPDWGEKACKTCKLEGAIGYVFGERRDILHQSYWRGAEGRSRRVPIVGDRIIWDQAEPWDEPIRAAVLPGEGPVRSMTTYYLGGAARQTLWRGSQGWSRTVPASNGVVEWAKATEWRAGITIDKLPGKGAMQAHSDYIIGDALHQVFWRGNEGWHRSVPIENGAVNWARMGQWQGPAKIAALPGKGNMQSADNLVVGDTLHQAFWRGGRGWSRTVPIENGAARWQSAGAWQGPLKPSDLPGSGEIRGQLGFAVPYAVGLRK